MILNRGRRHRGMHQGRNVIDRDWHVGEDLQHGNRFRHVLCRLVVWKLNNDLFDCIGKLPEKWKGVIASKYLDEKVSEDICKDLEITPSNLWVIIHRAKLLLRDCLRKRDVR